MSAEDIDTRVESLQAEVRRLRKKLSELTPSIETLLRRKGFKIFKKEPRLDLLLPHDKFVDSFFEAMKKYSFRLFLRDVIKNKDFFTAESVTWYATSDVTGDYIFFLEKTGLLKKDGPGYSLKKKTVRSFGATLEWFMAEIFKREFMMETIWGVKFKRPEVGGDYDLLAKIDGSILYMEVKSSPPKQIFPAEISAFMDRRLDLAPGIAIFFMDTELRMKDKIVPMFEEELKRRFPSPPPVQRMGKEIFLISGNIFIVNSKDSIIDNMERVLSYYSRKGG